MRNSMTVRTLESPSGAGTAFHSVWRSTGPRGTGSPSTGMVVLMAKSSTHLCTVHMLKKSRSYSWAFIHILCVWLCMCMREKWAREHFGTKLDFYALFTYKGRQNPYWLKSSEMSCWSRRCIRGVSFFGSDLCMWLELHILPEPIQILWTNGFYKPIQAKLDMVLSSLV